MKSFHLYYCTRTEQFCHRALAEGKYMDIHKYKFVTIVNDVEAPLSLRGSQRMGQFVTEKGGLFTPDTLTTL